VDEIIDFAKDFSIVLKPLKEYGGKGILKIDGPKITDNNEYYDTETYLRKIETYIREEGYLAMQFLKNVSKGDKRILVVGGEIMAASLRMPAEGSWLCNVAQGGYAVPAEPDPEEILMMEAIGPKLMEQGIFIFGADTLVNDDGKRVLSEINTLSIGGFPQSEQQTGRPIVQNLINKIITYVDDKKRK
jgi:glutathione synthase